MRRVFTLLLFVPFLAAAQHDITGFGKLKLKRSYSEIVADLGLEKIKEAGKDKLDFSDVFHPRKPVLLRYDTSWRKEPDYSYMFIKVPGAAKLLVPSYKVSDIEVKDIELCFYHDTLYSISISDPTSEFMDAITTKYGKGDLNKEVNSVKCSSAYTGSYDVDEVTYRTTWESADKDITVCEILKDYRDSKCKQQYLHVFWIANDDMQTKIRKWEREISQLLEERKEQEKKSKLTDF